MTPSSFSIDTRPNRGFTLADLLVTLAIVAILTTIAIPSFSYLIANDAMSAHINRFVSHIHYARSEAIKRRERIVICPTIDTSRCLLNGDWHEGWMVFVDSRPNRELDRNEELLLSVSEAPGGISMVSSRYRRRLVFQDSGMPLGSNITIRFCRPDEAVSPKALIMSNTGRPRLSAVMPDGKEIPCPKERNGA